jgi:hypothetical protein
LTLIVCSFEVLQLNDAGRIMVLGGEGCSAPWMKIWFFILFHFISFYFIAFVCLIYGAVARSGWAHLSAEQTGKPDHLSFA